ncbi:hypothetical protein BGX26_010561 [Mortierella sp. AD094]|nr:hypothetical protein BGX26_010561 [Mortierella sp. AD094]
MTDVVNAIASLASSISTNASLVKVNKRVYIASQQLQLIEECDKDLKKFAGSGLFRRFLAADAVGRTCGLHMTELDEWLGRIPKKSSKEDAIRDHTDDRRYLSSLESNQRKAAKMASSNSTVQIIGRLIVNLDDLGVDRTEVGNSLWVPSTKEHTKENRSTSENCVVIFPNISHIRAGIMLARCISGCSNIVQIHEICGRIIVTAMPANGPLNVSVVHRDIKAANILPTDELEPKITGFEMCEEEGAITGYFPDVEVRQKK